MKLAAFIVCADRYLNLTRQAREQLSDVAEGFIPEDVEHGVKRFLEGLPEVCEDDDLSQEAYDLVEEIRAALAKGEP